MSGAGGSGDADLANLQPGVVQCILLSNLQEIQLLPCSLPSCTREGSWEFIAYGIAVIFSMAAAGSRQALEASRSDVQRVVPAALGCASTCEAVWPDERRQRRALLWPSWAKVEVFIITAQRKPPQLYFHRVGGAAVQSHN